MERNNMKHTKTFWMPKTFACVYSVVFRCKRQKRIFWSNSAQSASKPLWQGVMHLDCGHLVGSAVRLIQKDAHVHLDRGVSAHDLIKHRWCPIFFAFWMSYKGSSPWCHTKCDGRKWKPDNRAFVGFLIDSDSFCRSITAVAQKRLNCKAGFTVRAGNRGLFLLVLWVSQPKSSVSENMEVSAQVTNTWSLKLLQ